MLRTNLKHIESNSELEELLKNNVNVMICCGRMGPMCVPVYASMEILEHKYTHISFFDMEFDIPEAKVIRNLPECNSFMGLPFTVYFKNGKVVTATSSIQTQDQVMEILDREFPQ